MEEDYQDKTEYQDIMATTTIVMALLIIDVSYSSFTIEEV